MSGKYCVVPGCSLLFFTFVDRTEDDQDDGHSAPSAGPECSLRRNEKWGGGR
jgi:hypothetical protein